MGKDLMNKKDELYQMVFVEKLSYLEIGRRYSVSDVYIIKILKKLGFDLPKRKQTSINHIPHNKGKFKTIKCLRCGIELKPNHPKQIYCSHICSTEYKKEKTYENYLNNQEQYYGKHDLSSLKNWFLKDQDYKCDICNINNNWNGFELIFVLDHIDGNADNNYRENLRLVCPNCDSQLDTFKSKNKNSSRKERYILQYKNL
jgi:hypothetical protein